MLHFEKVRSGSNGWAVTALHLTALRTFVMQQGPTFSPAINSIDLSVFFEVALCVILFYQVNQGIRKNIYNVKSYFFHDFFHFLSSKRSHREARHNARSLT